MNDLQRLMDAFSESSRLMRGQYQLTLGKLSELLAALPGGADVTYDDGHSPGDAMSYRGYYSDLAFSDSRNSRTVSEMLQSVNRAIGDDFTGYKGGEFKMAPDTPVWRSDYGYASGIAMMDVSMSPDGKAVIQTKLVD